MSKAVQKIRFETGALAAIAGVSLRQLQWWDERQVIVPRIEGHRRSYDSEDAIMVLLVSEMRRKGLSLQTIRRFLPKLNKLKVAANPPFAVIVGNNFSFCDSAADVITVMKAAKSPAVLISIGDAVQKVATQ